MISKLINQFQRSFLLFLILSGFTAGVLAQNKNQSFEMILKNSFRSEGIADVVRLKQDENQSLCTHSQYMQTIIGRKKQAQLEMNALANISPPADGKYLGDWKSGELIAQNGRGATWSDSMNMTNGGGCYNCHQMSSKEISYGTLGPSLVNYGNNRGASPEMLQYTWNRISNSKAYNLCSKMPRFAQFKLLTEAQIKDLMALLFDPQSPVNQ